MASFDSRAQQLTQIITAYWHSQALYVAAELGIADQLRDGPQPVETLARLVNADADSLFRLLRALASIGIFAETEPRTFSQTPLSELLRSDVPQSQRALARMLGGDQYLAWGDLLYSVRTGKTAFDRRFGMPVFDYLATRPEQAAIFDDAMTGVHGQETAAVLAAYDFSGIQVLADIGGGNGSNLTAILNQYPALQGILFDLPHVIDRARPAIEASGLGDRCRLVPGNFFEDVPGGADAYLMRHIIHDWDDERSRTILTRVRSRIPQAGRLLILESVIPPGNARFGAKFLDLTMLAIPGGRERTREEFEALLEATGFRLSRIVPADCEISVIEAAPR